MKKYLTLILLIPLFAKAQVTPAIDTGANRYVTAYQIKNTTAYYTSAGLITRPVKVWDGIITPTTGAGQTIDISSAGFTSINSITLTPANNTTSVISMPFVNIKSYTTSQITINIIESNNQTVSILGTLVTPLVTATSFTGISVHVRVDGW